MKYLRNISQLFTLNQACLALICIVVLNTSISAQNIAISKAVTELQSGSLDSSKVYIDRASEHEETKNQVKTWYYRGYIYKKLYTSREASNPSSPYRKEALQSLKRFFELDTVSDYHESAYKAFKFLASTYYNDAANLITEGSFESSIAAYNSYKDAMKVIEKDFFNSDLEVQFYLVLGQQYNKKYEEDRNEKSYFEKSKDSYLHVISLDTVNTSAHYNLALLYYNDAVEIIKNLDYDLDLITLELIQDEVVQLFKQSLPYMEKALSLDPCREATYTGLSGIYFSLNRMDESKLVQEQLDYIKAPKVLELFDGELTENSYINYFPVCTGKKDMHFVKVVKVVDVWFRVDSNNYQFVSGNYILKN